MDNASAVGTAALWASVHTVRVLVNRGLVSPNEVDEIYGSMIEGLQSGEAEWVAAMESRLEGVFAEMRRWAGERWIGKGETDPR